MSRLVSILLLVASAHAADLVSENFNGTSGGLSGGAPAVNELSSATWFAGPIFLANGSVNDGGNTDQGAFLDLGADFAFEEDATYTVALTWSGLSNAILFAGFSTAGTNPSGQAQVQGTNFALRVREQSTTPGKGLWTYNGSSTYTAGTTSSPSGNGTSTLTIITNQLANATASVDGSPPVTVNLTDAYRYLYIGYEDPTSGESQVTLESLVLTGPAPLPPPPAVDIAPASGMLKPGETVAIIAPAGFVLRYTLDGSDPTDSSPVYSGPLVLSASSELRARSFAGCLAGPVASAHFAVVPAARPNVVLLIGDRIGAGDLSCYGSVSTSTPQLDRLAAKGMRFTGLCAVGPGDTSSPYSLLTGRVPRRGNLADTIPADQAGIDRREWTLAESYRKAGYDTAFIGAWPLGSAAGSHPLDQGFTLFHGLPWLPGQIPAPSLMENDAVIGPAPADPANAFASRAESYLSSRGGDPFFLVVEVPSVPVGGSSLLGPTGDRIEAFDHAAGRVIQRLDQLGLGEETLVLFLSASTADRSPLGPSLGSNAQFRDGNGTTWDGGLKLPAIARWSGVIPPGTTNFASLWLPDLCPSLGALGEAWRPADRPYDGTAKPEVLLGARRRTVDDTMIFHHRRSGITDLIPAVRSGPWKLHASTNNLDPENPSPGAAPLLYQSDVDPSERINLASAQASRVSGMQAALAAHTATFSAAVPQLPPAEPPFLEEVTRVFPASGGVRFTYRRPSASLDDRYLLEFSDNLTSWFPEPSEPWVESVTRNADATETVIVVVPPNHPRWAGNRAFVRLRADHP
jgi:arylsulfatase A